MKYISLFAICIISVRSVYAIDLTKAETPETVVADVIRHDDWGDTKKSDRMFSESATELMKKRFTDEFVKDWNRITKASKNSPLLDGDILTGAQGISGVTFESAKIIKQTDVNAKVEASFSYFEDEIEGRPKKTTSLGFYLIKQNGVWKVDDYDYEDWATQPKEKTTSNLKSIMSTFRKAHKKN